MHGKSKLDRKKKKQYFPIAHAFQPFQQYILQKCLSFLFSLSFAIIFFTIHPCCYFVYHIKTFMNISMTKIQYFLAIFHKLFQFSFFRFLSSVLTFTICVSSFVLLKISGKAVFSFNVNVNDSTNFIVFCCSANLI